MTCYQLFNGRTAAAVLQLHVRPARNFDDLPVVNEVFDARVGRVLYVDGTRVMDDANDKLQWVAGKLGLLHPLTQHLTVVCSAPLARAWKVVEDGDNVTTYPKQPDVVTSRLTPLLLQDPVRTADTMGDIWYRDVVKMYTQCAVDSSERGNAAKAVNPDGTLISRS